MELSRIGIGGNILRRLIAVGGIADHEVRAPASTPAIPRGIPSHTQELRGDGAR